MKRNEPIYTICKYSPLELLSGFSLKTERLDPTPISFSCAESCGHPNLCGYGKAVLEEVLSRDIRCLLLVDCCDVCRRIYDILLNRGGMKFLYLLPLPHKNGSGEITRMERELRRLSDALCQMTGREFDLPLALDAWRRACQAEVLSTPHILLTGAHGGSSLLRTVQARSNLPIVDETCTGNRGLLQPPDLPDRDMFFRTYAQALLCQEKPCMRMQFREEGQNPNAVGVICHTMKFCDYYGFRYAAMKKKWKVPTLKIETDATPQSSGQLHTRLDAFFETIQPRKKVEVAKGVVNYVAGVDSGSASTDAVILDGEKRIVASTVLPTGAGAAAGVQKALNEVLRQAGLNVEDLAAIVATGYGRETVGTGNTSVTEITCHAKGAHHLFPQARTVIDIGGQDSKVICLDGNGNVTNFVMNDKCAAGTGRFLENMARTLQLSLDEMSELGLRWKKDVTISSMCTVFAESEVVSLVAANTETTDIIHGLNQAVANKTASLVRRIHGEAPYIMSGGVAKNRGVVKALEEALNAEIYVPQQAQICGALGAALIAWEEVQYGQSER